MTTTPVREGGLHPRIQHHLQQAGLIGALTEVTTPRFQKFLLQPKFILRNGWLLDPEVNIDQREVRTYVLGTPANHEHPQTVGQRLEINRAKRQATLSTYAAEKVQTIRFDMSTMQVIDNELN